MYGGSGDNLKRLDPGGTHGKLRYGMVWCQQHKIIQNRTVAIQSMLDPTRHVPFGGKRGSGFWEGSCSKVKESYG